MTQSTTPNGYRTTHTVHQKSLVVVSDAQRRIQWAAATDGWETDYWTGSAPEMG